MDRPRLRSGESLEAGAWRDGLRRGRSIQQHRAQSVIAAIDTRRDRVKLHAVYPDVGGLEAHVELEDAVIGGGGRLEPDRVELPGSGEIELSVEAIARVIRRSAFGIHRDSVRHTGACPKLKLISGPRGVG